MKIKSLILSLAAIMGLTFASCEKDGENGGADSLSLSRNSAIVEVGKTINITAAYGDNDVTSSATWTSSDEAVATVSAGVVTPVAEGTVTITCTYNEASATCSVQVIAGVAASTLLNGSDYYIFNMNETNFEKIANKVTSDMRANGNYNDDGSVPDGVTRVIQIWNASGGADAPQTGQDSFGEVDEWYSCAALPVGSGDWDNICGGLAILSNDTERGKLVNLTPDHVFAVTLKGSYTATNYLEIAMTPPTGGDNAVVFRVEKKTGENADGDWELFTISYTDLVALGVDLSQPITADTWFPFTFTANGGSSRVDIDCVMFYVPAK